MRDGFCIYSFDERRRPSAGRKVGRPAQGGSAVLRSLGAELLFVDLVETLSVAPCREARRRLHGSGSQSGRPERMRRTRLVVVLGALFASGLPAIAGTASAPPAAADTTSPYALVSVAGSPLGGLTTASPYRLSPTFSPSTTDYVLHCNAGTNRVTLALTGYGGPISAGTNQAGSPVSGASVDITLDVAPNQAIVVFAPTRRTPGQPPCGTGSAACPPTSRRSRSTRPGPRPRSGPRATTSPGPSPAASRPPTPWCSTGTGRRCGTGRSRRPRGRDERGAPRSRRHRLVAQPRSGDRSRDERECVHGIRPRHAEHHRSPPRRGVANGPP